jgi:hypothetical protein
MAPRNLRKIPPEILERIRTFAQDDVVVACAKFLRPEDVTRYAPLGLSLANGKLITPPPALPNPNSGRFSKANMYGYEKVRTDLPKVPKTISAEAPNWRGSGTHTVSWTRQVYVRDFYSPKEVELSVTLLEEKNGGFVVKFAIEQVINQRTPNFEQELFYNLNLLQENVGAADVFPSAATLAQYAETVRVDWQILPPGTVDEVVRQMLQGKHRVTENQAATMRERIEVMSRLKPEAYIAGTDGFLRYFGAKFGEDFVVFENARYGNAIYVMYEAWQDLSKRSRVELLAGSTDNFDRIEHRDGWEDRLKAAVNEYRKSKRTGKR